MEMTVGWMKLIKYRFYIMMWSKHTLPLCLSKLECNSSFSVFNGDLEIDEDDENDKDRDNLIVQINDCKWGLPRHFRCFRTRYAGRARPNFLDEITILKTMRSQAQR